MGIWEDLDLNPTNKRFEEFPGRGGGTAIPRGGGANLLFEQIFLNTA